MLIPAPLLWHESNSAVAGDGALVQVRSCETLVILITSIGEFLLFHCHFFSFTLKKKKLCCRIFFFVILVLPYFLAGVHVLVGKPEAAVISNINQMEHLEGEQYSQVRNPRAYMSMRDYRSLPWQNQQPLGRNPNPNRSLMDYRDQCVSAPSYIVPPQYAPPPHPQYASLSQPQPPQPISPVEQAILDLTKLVGDVVEEQKKFNAQLSQRILIVENSLDQKLDGLQSGIDHKIDNLHTSISRLAQQHVHQEEENMEEECILGEQAQMQPQGELMQEPLEASEEQQVGGGRGKGAGEEHQRLTLHPIPINLDPSVTAQPKNNPLPKAPSHEPMYILPAAQPTPKTPPAKAIPFTLPALQNLRKLVATVQAFATTSKTLAATHVA